MNRKLFTALAAVITCLVFAGCILPLDPVNAIDPNSLVDPNTGTIQVFNNSATPPGRNVSISAVRIIQPNGSFSEFPFGGGLGTGKYSEKYRFSSGQNYQVKFHDGRGWTVNAKPVFVEKGENVIVPFDGTEEISIDLSGAKGKLIVFNRIPPATGKNFTIENIRVSREEDGQETEVYYFYQEGEIAYEESHNFDILPGTYWVRARIRNSATGKLSKWSIPALEGQANNTVSGAPGEITVSAATAGIAVFNDKVLRNGEVDTGYPGTSGSEYPEVPDNGNIDNNGNETPNVDGTVDGGANPVLAVKVEKLGFTGYKQNGVEGTPVYTYAQKSDALKEARIVKTNIYNMTINPGSIWKLALSEVGWYLLSFSEDGLKFSKGFPIRLSRDAAGNWVVEPSVIPPYNGDDSTWVDKPGVILSNDTPVQGGPIYGPDGNLTGETLTPAEAQRPITDVKIYNPDGSLYGYYRNSAGMPIANNKEWMVNPPLPPGDYLITVSDDYGETWTDPPFPFHVDENGNGRISYDKTHPWWTGKVAGKPRPERPKSGDPWDEGTKKEIDGEAVIVTVPAEPPLEIADAANPPENTSTEPGSQLDVINKSAKSPAYVINYLKLNRVYTPAKAYRIIDVSAQGGIVTGKRLSLVGFDLKPDLYWVYVSQDGQTWYRYKKKMITIPTPWVYEAGVVKPNTTVDKVIYLDVPHDDWTTEPPGTGSGTPPGPVTNLSAVAGSGYVALSWTYSTASTLAAISYSKSATPDVIEDTQYVMRGAATAGTRTIYGLINDVPYIFTVKAGNDAGLLSVGVTVTKTPAGGAAESWDITDVNGAAGNGQVTLSWVNPGAVVFKGVSISYTPVMGKDPPFSGTDAGSTVMVGEVLKPGTSKSISSLENGRDYRFVIKAVNTSNSSGPGHTVIRSPMANVSDTTPPAEVAGLTAVGGNGQVTLNWANPADVDFKEAVISVESAVPSGNNLPLPRIVAKPGASLTFTGLTNGTKYTFKVRTRDTSGNLSNGVSALGEPMISIPVNTIEVGTITATGVTGTNDTVRLSWTSPPGDGYKVAIARESGDLPSGHSLNLGPIEAAGTQSSVEIAGLTGKKLYTFRVRTWNISTSQLSVGNVSPPVSPGPPENVTVTKTVPGHQSIYLEWTKPDDPRFDSVDISIAGGSPGTLASTATSLTYTGLTNDTVYTVTIKSKGKFDVNAVTGVTVNAMPFDTLYIKAGGSDTAATAYGDRNHPLLTASEAANRFKAAVTKPAVGTIVVLGTVNAASPVIIDGNCPPVMTLKGESGILQTTSAIAGTRFLVTVNGDRKLILESGLTLRGGGDSYNIQGVSVTGGGKFTLNGGTITLFHNSNLVTGGGVSMSGGEFIMNSGTISYNTADNAGGVYLYKTTFAMYNGTISYNKAFSNAGVVLDACTTSAMSGGTISYNTATASTGGLGLGVNTIFTMSGTAKISSNVCAAYGGGMNISYATFNMSGSAEISGNTAGSGGGILLTNSTFNMTGGTISGNTASIGGGVWASDSDIHKTGSSIIYGSDGGASANKATSAIGIAVVWTNPIGTIQKKRQTTAGPGVNLNINRDATNAIYWE
jgi:hypothetical protein